MNYELRNTLYKKMSETISFQTFILDSGLIINYQLLIE